MPALKLDVALLHVNRADRAASARSPGPTTTWTTCSPGPRPTAFVTCDELVDSEYFHHGQRAARFKCSGSAT